MSTHAYIGYMAENDNVRFVYCHFDGGLRHVGKTLLDNYTTLEQVKALVEKGNMSSLASTVEETKYYNEPVNKEWAFMYKRKHRYIPYIYLFENGEWTVNNASLSAHWPK